MRYLFLIICILCGGVIAQVHGNDKPEKNVIGQNINDGKKAEKIAEDYFLKMTDRKVKKYSIKSAQQEKTNWVYFIKGEEGFARPGYHWIVKVNKFNGKPEILEGE